MSAAKETAFRRAVFQIRSRIKDASLNGPHVYAFHVPEDQLESAYALLDKEENRRSMRVTYSLDHNFIIRHMPSRAHDETAQHFNNALLHALNGLTPTPTEPEPPGCEPIGITTFNLGNRQKQADGGVRPTGSNYPSVVLEVGNSETLGQLRVDAKLWLESEHTTEVNLVVLICIDGSLPPNTTPRITMQLWQAAPPAHLDTGPRVRHAFVAQNDDWTLNETPLRISLSDIFGDPIPAAYTGFNHVDLNTKWLRQKIISSCR